jgi:SAM-dependent methyltransferase
MSRSKDEFKYIECEDCGCISLQNVPSDLSKLYPDEYYSMGSGSTSPARKLRAWLYMSQFSKLVDWRARTDLDVLKRCKFQKGQKLLDVGCGAAGRLVRDLRELGYAAEGIDPFIANDVSDRFGVVVRKTTLDSVEGRYDIIFFRHSLEHMPQQLEMLRSARKRLAPGGTCMVCIPVVGWAWRQYGVNWCNFDAPRHLVIHTLKSLAMLAEAAGFRVDDVVYDSNEFQILTSELYANGRPQSDLKLVDRETRNKARAFSRELNSKMDGDMAQFYLR